MSRIRPITKQRVKSCKTFIAGRLSFELDTDVDNYKTDIVNKTTAVPS